MTSRRTFLLSAAALPMLSDHTHAQPAHGDRAAEVRAAEIAFAATMARRDQKAFATFIADDAVFMNGGKPLRGKAAVVEHWTRFFSEPVAPFSWQPEIVEISSGGTLGYSEGPVRSSSGEQASRYYTTWQRNPDGRWLVVFDAGYAVCK
jgi:ketosteroid isomerase-like protein